MYHCGQIITVNDVTVIIMDAKTNSNLDTDPLSQLGTKVARKRKDDLKISQDELLERMRHTRYRPDVSRQSHISNIENSDGEKLPSIRVLAALAEASNSVSALAGAAASMAAGVGVGAVGAPSTTDSCCGPTINPTATSSATSAANSPSTSHEIIAIPFSDSLTRCSLTLSRQLRQNIILGVDIYYRTAIISL